MEWNVFYYNMNKRKIEKFNIFDHGRFTQYVKEHLKTCKTKEEFAEHLRSELIFYFWCKSEWELIFAPWFGGDREKDAIKVDVYEQVMCNFDVLLDYVWNNRKEWRKESV